MHLAQQSLYKNKQTDMILLAHLLFSELYVSVENIDGKENLIQI